MMTAYDEATRADIEEAIEHRLISRENEHDPRRLWLLDTQILELARRWAEVECQPIDQVT
jgi:hypothetical protein